jgi:hypothetical protein
MTDHLGAAARRLKRRKASKKSSGGDAGRGGDTANSLRKLAPELKRGK